MGTIHTYIRRIFHNFDDLMINSFILRVSLRMGYLGRAFSNLLCIRGRHLFGCLRRSSMEEAVYICLRYQCNIRVYMCCILNRWARGSLDQIIYIRRISLVCMMVDIIGIYHQRGLGSSYQCIFPNLGLVSSCMRNMRLFGHYGHRRVGRLAGMIYLEGSIHIHRLSSHLLPHLGLSN